MFGLTLQPGINEFTAEYDLSVLTVGKYSNYFTVITSYGGGTYGVEDWIPASSSSWWIPLPPITRAGTAAPGAPSACPNPLSPWGAEE